MSYTLNIENDRLELKLNFDSYIQESEFNYFKNKLYSKCTKFNNLIDILPINVSQDFVNVFYKMFDNGNVLQKYKDLFINNSYLTDLSYNNVSQTMFLNGSSTILVHFDFTLTLFLNQNPTIVKNDLDDNYIKEWDLKL